MLRQVRAQHGGQDADPGRAVDAALQRIRSRGCSSASPNAGFIEQLRWFAAITGGHRRERAAAELAYRVFRMEAIRREYGTLMLEMLPPEVTAATSRADVDTIYRCRGCRDVLFTSDNVLPHNSGEGQAAFSWYRRDRSCDVADTACNTLHLEPMTWMGIIGNYEVQGKLKCSCGQKLGSFHWAGMQCSCGAWVTPAFAVGKAKVDAVGNQTLAVAAAPRPASGGEVSADAVAAAAAAAAAMTIDPEVLGTQPDQSMLASSLSAHLNLHSKNVAADNTVHALDSSAHLDAHLEDVRGKLRLARRC
jgi:dual specificity phosphatase 12